MWEIFCLHDDNPHSLHPVRIYFSYPARSLIFSITILLHHRDTPLFSFFN